VGIKAPKIGILRKQKCAGENMYRSNIYDEDFSRDMEHLIARKVYLMELIENEDEPMSIEEALRFTIRRMGLVEFSNLVGEKKQNVSKFLTGERNLKRETLDKYLKPFGLHTVLQVKPFRKDKVA
jgi:DNA-binding phage protein